MKKLLFITFILFASSIGGQPCFLNGDAQSLGEDFTLDFSLIAFSDIITSHGAAKNEAWKPYTSNYPEHNLSGLFNQYQLSIFNRWGNLIFESDSYNKHWRGLEHEEGVYFHIIEYASLCDDDILHKAEGNVQLVE